MPNRRDAATGISNFPLITREQSRLLGGKESIVKEIYDIIVYVVVNYVTTAAM